LSRQNRELEEIVRERTAKLELEVAERRHAAALLQQTEEMYRALFEHAVFGMFQITPQGRVLAANSALARIGGYSSIEELMTSATDVFTQLCADPNRVQEFIRSMHEHGSVTGFEGPMFRKDGTPMWTSTSARTVRDSKGEVLYFEGTLEDISARKRAEEVLESTNQELELRVQKRTTQLTRANEELRASHSRLEAVLSAVPVILWGTDRSGRFTFTAGNCWNLIGQQRERLIGKSVFEMYGDHPQIVSNHQRVLQGEIVETTVELQGLILDARHVPLRDADGELRGMLGVAVDATEQKHAEAAMREQKEILQTIFDRIPAMIVVYDEEGKFRLVNQEWERVLGWSTEEIQAEPDIVAKLCPTDEELQRVRKIIANPEGEWMDFKTRARE
ncbi:MAG: PAS domain S-box protein, partial [Verrucomicrobiaceae bacterium]